MEDLTKPYFPLRNDLNYGETILVGKYSVKGYGIYILLQQEINKSYYLRFSEDISSMLARKWNTSTGLVSEIVDSCVRLNLFNSEKYKKYGILTSEEIQINHFTAIKRRKFIELNKDYLISSITPKLQKMKEFESFFRENVNNLDREKETKQNETKQDETKLEESKTSPKTSLELVLSPFEKFKKEFPEKVACEEFEFPDYVNVDLLISKIKESPQFLLKCNNLDIKWCSKKVNYSKIIADGYKDKDSTQIRFENHKYSKEQLDGLFVNIEKIN